VEWQEKLLVVMVIAMVIVMVIVMVMAGKEGAGAWVAKEA
jgi:preprotein translocase subunit SecG